MERSLDWSNFPADLEKRHGRFEIDIDEIRKRPWVAMLVLEKVLVTRAESMLVRRVVEYEGLSPLFRAVEVMGASPWYDFTVSIDKGKVEVRCTERVEEIVRKVRFKKPGLFRSSGEGDGG